MAVTLTNVKKGGYMRKEYKWQLDLMRSEQLKRSLAQVMVKDPHANTKGFYWVTSLYFDDCFDSRLSEKIEGGEKRPKVRLRYYSKDDIAPAKHCADMPLYFESKLKKGDYVVKHRKLIKPQEAALLIQSPWQLNRLFPDAHAEALAPVQIIRYKRYSWVMSAVDLRITFDEQIMGSLNRRPSIFDNNCYGAVLDGNTIIMEVKCKGDLPSHIRAILSDAGIKSAWSKYAYSRQML